MYKQRGSHTPMQKQVCVLISCVYTIGRWSYLMFNYTAQKHIYLNTQFPQIASAITCDFKPDVTSWNLRQYSRCFHRKDRSVTVRSAIGNNTPVCILPSIRNPFQIWSNMHFGTIRMRRSAVATFALRRLMSDTIDVPSLDYNFGMRYLWKLFRTGVLSTSVVLNTFILGRRCSVSIWQLVAGTLYWSTRVLGNS